MPEGKRAMTVRVNDVIGVAGFALPGTFVDIMVNTQEEGSTRSDRDHAVSKIVLERILVLAVAQESDRDSTKPKVVNAVTLELTPAQAEILDLARSVGTLSLVLRNQTESGLAGTVGRHQGATAGRQARAGRGGCPGHSQRTAVAPPSWHRRRPRPPPRRPPPAANCVEVIRGLSRVTECF